MDEMKWTKDKPTVEGWYWYRYFRHNSDKPIFYPAFIYKDVTDKWIADNGKYQDDLTDLLGGEFCYIIPQPENI